MTDDGSSTMRLIYSVDGRLEERQFIYNGQLVKRTKGVSCDYSIIKYNHRDDDRVSELTFWAPDDQPVNATLWLDDSV